MRISWLVCETTPRWSKAVRRFGPAALPAPGDALSVTRGSAPQIRVGPARSGSDAGVVLWVLERESINEVVAAIADWSTAPRRTLQLAALDDSLTLRGVAGCRARLALHEWQIAAVLEAPEQLPRLLPLIRRHLQAIRPAHEPLETLLDLGR